MGEGGEGEREKYRLRHHPSSSVVFVVVSHCAAASVRRSVRPSVRDHHPLRHPLKNPPTTLAFQYPRSAAHGFGLRSCLLSGFLDGAAAAAAAAASSFGTVFRSAGRLFLVVASPWTSERLGRRPGRRRRAWECEEEEEGVNAREGERGGTDASRVFPRAGLLPWSSRCLLFRWFWESGCCCAQGGTLRISHRVYPREHNFWLGVFLRSRSSRRMVLLGRCSASSQDDPSSVVRPVLLLSLPGFSGFLQQAGSRVWDDFR